MTVKLIDDTKLSSIGDAIRDKTGKTELLTLDDMPTEIAAIETGGGSSGGDSNDFLTWFNELVEHNDYAHPYSYEINFPDVYFIPSIGGSGTWGGNIAPSTLNDDKAISENNYFTPNGGRLTKINLPQLRVIPQAMFYNLRLDENVEISEFTNVRYLDVQALENFNYYGTVAGIKLSFPELLSAQKRCFDSTRVSCLYLPKLKRFSGDTPFYYSRVDNVYLRDITTLGDSSRSSTTFGYEVRIKKLIIDNEDSCPTLGSYLMYYPHVSDSNCFYNGSAKIYVPQSILSAYETATNWSVYYAAGNILAIEDSEDELKGLFPALDEKMGWE